MFSDRTGWSLAANRLAAALEARRRAGREILDLTVSNPTRAGIAYPAEEIAAAMAAGSAPHYDPDPRGLPAAREAIAASYAERGAAVDPERIVLTASTREAYGWLFKLLCDPGDRVLAPRPSYPLFEYLARLESIEIATYPLRYDGRWELDRGELLGVLGPAPLPKDVIGGRGPSSIVLVNPNNPTGSFISEADLEFLLSVGGAREAVLISDEVFGGYPLEGPGALVTSLLGRDDAPAFVLDGLSKSAGLPGAKAGWIVALGPTAFRDEALARLEVVADTYLSVATPVQRALPRLIELGRGVADAIRARTRANLAALRQMLHDRPEVEELRAEGGWSVVLRVPATRSEEIVCLDLLEQDGVLVQPGWYFDFDREAYLVVSLLPPPAVFREGIARLLRRVPGTSLPEE